MIWSLGTVGPSVWRRRLTIMGSHRRKGEEEVGDGSFRASGRSSARDETELTRDTAAEEGRSMHTRSVQMVDSRWTEARGGES